MDWAVNEWSVSGYPVIIVFDTVHDMDVALTATNDGVAASTNNTVKSIAWAVSSMNEATGFLWLAASAPDNVVDAAGALYNPTL